MKTKICEYANTIFDQLIVANSSLNIVKSINTITHEQGVDIFLPDISFWRVVLDNCCFRVLTELAKVFDTDSKSINIQKLVNQLSAPELGPFSKEIKIDIEKQYGTLHPILESLKVLRDKGLVHTDKEYAINPHTFVLLYSVDLPELDTLIHAAAEICNRILGAYSNKERSIEPIFPADVCNIIESVILANRVKHDFQYKNWQITENR